MTVVRSTPKDKTQAINNTKPMSLCRQLEMTIVAEKLERAFKRAQVRIGFLKVVQAALRKIQEQAKRRT